MNDQRPTAAVDGDDLTENPIVGNELDSSVMKSKNFDIDKRSHRFECQMCGYVYDPIEGVKKFGITSGTSFGEIDSKQFRCPVCRAKSEAFRDIGPREKPSGFEENMNYGFGANSLTSGQKNVLIFGGLALAVSFFLSLYSLR